MYCGETPLAMKLLRVGVRLRVRKSARNPSREMRMVVGRKVEVPLERMVGVFGDVVGVVCEVGLEEL